jgi:serine/threonine-protein kinase
MAQQIFGPYLLVERAGTSATGEVFTAFALDRERFGQVVLVKRVYAELSSSWEFVRAFSAVARLAALLDHPNIVRVIEHGQVKGAYFIATEHLDGHDLGSVLRALRTARRSLRSLPVAQICAQIARGLHAAHTMADPDGRPCRIVHGSLSPATVVLLRSGGVKIVDFDAVERPEPSGRVQTQHRNLARRLRYFSPEQVRGEPLEGSSDVFSLGATMWEMLTGRRLFASPSAFSCIGDVLHAPIPAPTAFRLNVPLALERIVMRALERDRSRRYPTAGEMAGDLDEFLRTRRTRPDAVRYILKVLFNGG